MKHLVLLAVSLFCCFTLLALCFPHGQAQDNAPLQGKIAFTSTRIGGKRQVLVMNADGSNPAPLTSRGENWKPAFSRDGTKIAFVSDRDGNREIYVMNSDGSDQRNITNSPANDEDPCFSPDGQKIAFHSNREDSRYKIFVVEITGRNVRRLTNSFTDDYGPAWTLGDPSSAGIRRGKIAFHRASTSQILVMDEDGGNLRRFAVGANASWSPDGSRITFWAEKQGRMNIFAMNADGSGLVQITDGTTIQRDPSWSLDGKRIVFVSNAGGTYDIFSVDARANLVTLLNDAGKPSWKDAAIKDKLSQLTNDPESDIHPSCGR